MLYPKFPRFPASFMKLAEDWKASVNLALIVATAKLVAILESRILALVSLCPGSLHDVEQELHREVARECVDPVVGGLIQAAHAFPNVQQQALQVMACQPNLRLQVATQPVQITLLGGSKCTVRTPYYLNRPPRGPGRPRAKGKRGPAGNGVYPVLEVLGVHYRVSPALGGEVGRSVAMGTVDQAQLTLKLRGIDLDRKVICRLAMCLAERALAYREWVKEQAEKGFRGCSCKGKRIVISTDGGRIRTRKSRRGRRLKSGHHRFDATWREPKVFVIYEIDAQGKKRRRGLLRYDATMEAADGLFLQLGAVLREIGAHEAEEWVIVADGAEWIWNRVPSLITALDYDSSRVTEIVDLYHAVQHLGQVAAEVKRWSDGQRKVWVKEMKRHLLDGKFQLVLEAIEELCRGSKAKKIRKLLPYLTDNADRLQYCDFKKKKIPIGSGAVESCVRRIINLRLKGNGIFWTLETAEGVLHLRAQMLSGRWDSFVKAVLQPHFLWSIEQELTAA